MKNMTLQNIALATGGVLHGLAVTKCTDGADGSAEVAGIVTDSRQVQPGFLFAAIRGEKVDGHSFIPKVKEMGAAGVVCEEAPDIDIPYILVKDVPKALRDMAAFYRRQLSVKVVGITGSVGKTSTKEVIASVLERTYRVCRTQGNFNNEIGVPLTVFSIKEEDEIAVIEMGINHFGEMHRLAEITRPDVCVITNIGECHLEFLGDRDGVLRAKTEMFEHLNEGAIAVLNGDDDKLATVREVQGRSPVFFGCEAGNDYTAHDIKPEGIFGSSFRLRTPAGELECYMPLPGEHMVCNAAAAAAVGEHFGMSHREIEEGIRQAKTLGGRSNLIKTPLYTIIDDCYNANPNSMKAALSLLALAEGRRVAVLGDMFELGDNEAELHAQVGETAAKLPTEVIICVGTLSRSMYEAACRVRGTGEQIFCFGTRQELEAGLGDILMPGDTVLVKASHGMEFSKVVELLGKIR